MFRPCYDHMPDDGEQFLVLSERSRQARASRDSDVQRSASIEVMGRMTGWPS